VHPLLGPPGLQEHDRGPRKALIFFWWLSAMASGLAYEPRLNPADCPYIIRLLDIRIINGVMVVVRNADGFSPETLEILRRSCRRGVTFETGYGGASIVGAFYDVEIKGGQAAASCGGNATAQVFINYGTTLVTIERLTLGGLSPGASAARQRSTAARDS
jgi:hypothetical protein